jgi:hypothetical protein
MHLLPPLIFDKTGHAQHAKLQHDRPVDAGGDSRCDTPPSS